MHAWSVRAAMCSVGLWAAAAGAQSTAAVDPPALEPGLWEVTAQPDFKGIPILAAPKIARRCLSEADIAAGKLPLASLPDCRVSGGTWERGALQLNFACEGLVPGVKVVGEARSAGKTLSGHIELIQPPQADAGAAPVSIKYRHTGRFLSAQCPASVGADALGPLY